MKKIGFITNIDKDPNLLYTNELVHWIKSKGCEILVTDFVDGGVADIDEVYTNADFIIVLGGDGTILRVARKAAMRGTPIMGINLGTLGYLAEVEKCDALSAIQKVLDEDYTIEKRMMLEAFIDRACGREEVGLALNEVCVSNSVVSRMISLSVEVNDDYINTFRADGIIVSTSTGSTAYNLSAGGPILKPDTELMAITYVCPHALYSRPFVISGDDVVKIVIEGDHKNAILSLDGQNSIPIKSGDKVIIRKSKYYTNTIKTTNLSFYDILRRKMVGIDSRK